MTANINISQEKPIEIEEHRSPDLADLDISLKNLPRLPLLAIIRFYQLTFSKTIPSDTCRFYPTCSHYSYQAIFKYGVLKGGWLGFTRILRCNPFNPGGVDPIP
ncbi:MAG: membrane protein insertion efficiency factor YidD [Chloroflexota bacterium]